MQNWWMEAKKWKRLWFNRWELNHCYETGFKSQVFTFCLRDFKLVLLCWAWSLSHVQVSVTPWTVTRQLLYPCGSPNKNTGMGCHFFLRGIFLTQKFNPGLLHCRQILYRLSHQGSPAWFQASPWTAPPPAPTNLCLHIGTPMRIQWDKISWIQ